MSLWAIVTIEDALPRAWGPLPADHRPRVWFGYRDVKSDVALWWTRGRKGLRRDADYRYASRDFLCLSAPPRTHLASVMHPAGNGDQMEVSLRAFRKWIAALKGRGWVVEWCTWDEDWWLIPTPKGKFARVPTGDGSWRYKYMDKTQASIGLWCPKCEDWLRDDEITPAGPVDYLDPKGHRHTICNTVVQLRKFPKPRK